MAMMLINTFFENAEFYAIVFAVGAMVFLNLAVYCFICANSDPVEDKTEKDTKENPAASLTQSPSAEIHSPTQEETPAVGIPPQAGIETPAESAVEGVIEPGTEKEAA